MACLNEHLARRGLASRTATDLGQQLEEPLLAAEIRAEKQRIRVNHCDQGDMGEVVALAQHLRTDHEDRITLQYPLHELRHGLTTGHVVAVDPDDRECREALLQKRFGLLGAETRANQSTAPAVRTLSGQLSASAAVVTVEARGCFVQRHPCIAIGAVTAPAAVMAHQCGSKASPVEEHHGLVARLQRAVYPLQQLGR